MKIIRKNQIARFEHGPSCTANEYPVDDKDINIAIIELNGRYPQKGWALNEISKELACIMEGSGSVVIDGNETQVSEGDLVMVYPGEKFFWQGKMKLFMPCVPAWNENQYKIIE